MYDTIRIEILNDNVPVYVEYSNEFHLTLDVDDINNHTEFLMNKHNGTHCFVSVVYPLAGVIRKSRSTSGVWR